MLQRTMASLKRRTDYALIFPLKITITSIINENLSDGNPCVFPYGLCFIL